MHDRAGGHRGLPTAISALVGEGFGLQQPGPAAAATRTDKPFRPPALEKVHRTRAFRRKAVLKFDQRPRKPSLRSRHHPTPRSSRYRGAAYSLVLVLYTKSRSTGRSCIGHLPMSWNRSKNRLLIMCMLAWVRSLPPRFRTMCGKRWTFFSSVTKFFASLYTTS